MPVTRKQDSEGDFYNDYSTCTNAELIQTYDNIITGIGYFTKYDDDLIYAMAARLKELHETGMISDD